MFTFRRQPFKAFYLTYLILTGLLIRFPFWTFKAAIPALRPRRDWSFSRALILPALRAFVTSFFAIGFPISIGQNPEEIAVLPTATEVGFIWVEPLKNEQIVGELKELAWKNNVEALKTSGYWFPAPSQPEAKTATNGEKVILHLHSGGHIMGSAHPKGGPAGPVCSGLLQHTQIKRIFACGYRLSSSAPYPAVNPFPAGVLDALAGYNYLIHTMGFSPQNIVISGDSSGGNLANAVVRYTVSNGSAVSLPAPRALLLLSPSVEWGLTHDSPGSSWQTNRATDYCGAFFEGYTQRSLLGNLPTEFAFTSPWISPASLRLEPSVVEAYFKGFPTTYLQSGGEEMQLDSMRTFRDRLINAIGKDQVRYYEVEGGTHDLITMEFFEPERTATLQDISLWLDKTLSE
ncbi:alpha/beta-hydrolase [Mycena floridula]|nr:alpha/beta-hydrolase [Mycena floridula]